MAPGLPAFRAPSAPAAAGLSRVVLKMVSGLSDYGLLRLRQRQCRFSHRVTWLV
ncbi:UNVERIFIED_ORG: hypothetical protein ABIB63_003168 [Xanthomonas axonopodis]